MNGGTSSQNASNPSERPASTPFGSRPSTKAQATPPWVYDPYDYFDLGDFDQKGGTKTWYGNKAELQKLIAHSHSCGVGLYADMVINHNSGADEEEQNPLDGETRWTKFTPKSEKFARDWNCFHPSRYERTMVEGENFAGFPHLCHRNPHVYAAMFAYARMLIEELGFDGFRFDFVKGYGSWMISLLSKYRYEKEGMPDFMPYVVAELWSGGDDIEVWLNKANSMTDGQIAAFDFPLRYKLKALCDHPNFDMRELTQGGTIVMQRPAHAATFVDNHDMGADTIVNDKLMAYSFIMVHEGYPCLFWYDYYNNQLDRPKTPNGLNALIEVHHRFAGGDSHVVHCDPDLYIMQRVGWKDDKVEQSGLVYVLNNLGNQWSGTSVQTQWKNQRFVPVAWDGHDGAHPDERRTDDEGRCEFPAPPRGFCIYVPVADDCNKDDYACGHR